MTRIIRFTPNPATPPTAPDGYPDVFCGVLDGEVARSRDGRAWPLAGIHLLPPCSPSKIVCVGRNYIEHVKELGNEVPPEPLIFLKPRSALLGHEGAIEYPLLSSNVHHEGELGVIIAKRARRVDAASAMEYVLGYTCVNDVTARDLQKRDGQWTRGKGFDTFCPVGPWIVPKKEVDFSRLRIRTWVDGELRQDAPVSDMIFSVETILAFISQCMTLEPGDLIATGTPPGVGPLQIGCEVAVEIEGIGVLRNRVVRANAVE